MCRRTVACAAALCALVAAGSVQLPAQTVKRHERLTREADAFGTLAQRLQRAADSVERAEAARRERLVPETLSVGRLRAVTRGIPAVTALGLLRRADSLWSASWMSTLPVYPGALLELVPNAPRRDDPSSVTATLTTPATSTAGARRLSAPLFQPTGRRPLAHRDEIALAALHLRAWIELRPAYSAVPGVTHDTTSLARSAFAQLAALPLSVGRRCLDGDVLACEQALSIRPLVPPYDDVLDASARVALLDDLRSVNWPVDYQTRKACTETADPELCRRAFANVTPGHLRTVLPLDARRLFAARLLLRTGPATVSGTRLKIADQDLDVAALAGDSLRPFIASWRASVIAHRPRQVLPSAASSWTALLFIAGLAALGMRSSRWRAE